MLQVMSRMMLHVPSTCTRHLEGSVRVTRSALTLDISRRFGITAQAATSSHCGSPRPRPRPRRSSQGAPPAEEQQVAAAAPPAAAPAPAVAGQQRHSKLLLVDGHGLAFRAYWGIQKSFSRNGGLQTLSTPDGIPTTVTFGFLRSLQVLLEEERPDALVVAFDAPQKSFRHAMLAEYKANRAKAPPGFGSDLRNLQLVLQFMRVCTVASPGYEADDVLAGVAQRASTEGYLVRVYTSDMDLYQIVDDAADIAVLRPAVSNQSHRIKVKGQSTTLIDEAGVQHRLQVTPAQVADYKALAGDASDNVPGISGIGPKTAVNLLSAYGSVEGVFQHLDSLKVGAASKLQGRQQDVAQYKNITLLRPEAVDQLDLDLDKSRLSGFNIPEVDPLLRRLELMSVIKDLSKLQQLMGGAAAASPTLAAAVPAAVEKLADCLDAQQRQLYINADVSSADAGAGIRSSSVTQSASGAAGGNSAGFPVSSGPFPSPRSSPLPAAVQLLTNSLQERIPDVQVITTTDQLRQLIERLQKHQGSTSWYWPQDFDYRPGATPPLPACISCMWDEVVTAEQLVARRAQGATSTIVHADDSSNGTDEEDSKFVADNSRRRTRRRTRTRAVSASSQLLAVAAAAVQPLQQDTQSYQQHQHQIQLAPGQQYLMPQLALVCPNDCMQGDHVLSTLRPLLEDLSRPKVMFESKRCYTELRHWGIQLAGVEFDVLVAGCLLDPERWKESTTQSKGPLEPRHQQRSVLPPMTAEVLGTPVHDLTSALAALHDGQTRASKSAGDDWDAAGGVWAVHALRQVYERELRHLADGGKLLKLLQDVEVPVQRVLSDMEYAGLGVDRELMQRQKQEIQAAATGLEAKLYEIAGEDFNLQSRQLLSKVMFDKLGLKPRDPNHVIPLTASGYKSTGMEHIEKLEDSPFKNTYKEWLYYNTLMLRYYTPSYMDAATPETGRIHTILHQVGGATGRINSSQPNLQNLPMHDPRAVEIRQAFNVPREGHVLVSADYSQVELRVLAALSGDSALQEALKGDVHSATARVLLNKSLNEPVSPEERQLGKRVNFSIAYGAGARKLAADVAIFAGDVGFTDKDGKMMLDKFFNAYPGLFHYMTQNQRSGVARGYTQSYLGRRRLFRFQSERLRRLLGTSDLTTLPDMKGLRQLARSEADSAVLRQAGNAPVQGTSADVLKLALLELHQKLTVAPYNCRLVLTVHDEVVMEVPLEHWPGVVKQITQIMEGVLPLMLKVDVQQGW